MVELSQNFVQHVRYKDIVLQRAKEYREKDKEKLKEYHKNRYKNLSSEEKIKLVEKRKEWFNRQTKEKQKSIQKIDIITIWLLLKFKLFE